MRVLHVDSSRDWRGGQNQVLLTVAGLRERGCAAELACQRGGVLESRARAAGIDPLPLRFHGDLSPAAVVALRRAIRASRPDVVQCHDPHALSAGTLAAGGLAPVVATRRVDFALRGALSRVKYRACRRVIAVSRAVAAVLGRSGLSGERVRLVHEGVPDRAPRPGGERALAALGVPAGSPVVGNVAALTDHKDHATLIEAAARVAEQLPEVRFVVAGDGELRASLERRIAARGLAERWIFAGFRDDVHELLSAFTVFCLSSHMEGLGTSLLDAMALTRPIVATAAGGIPDAIEDGVTGRLVPVRDPVALAAALSALLRDPGERARLAAGARRRFEAEFTAERMVTGTLAVLEEARSELGR